DFAVRSGGGRAPGLPVATGLLVDGSHPAALHGDSGHRHRGRRAGWRRAHLRGVVQPRRTGSWPEAHSAHPADAAARGAGEQGRVNRRKAEGALLFNVVIWGVTFVLVKRALHEISPGLFLAMRFSLAALAQAALFGVRVRPEPGWQARACTTKMLAAGGVIGLFLFAPFLLQTVGLQTPQAPQSA